MTCHAIQAGRCAGRSATCNSRALVPSTTDRTPPLTCVVAALGDAETCDAEGPADTKDAVSSDAGPVARAFWGFLCSCPLS